MSMTILLAALTLGTVDLNPLDLRWTFGAHEPYTMYRRVGRHCTGGVDGNAEWVKPWLDWWDSESPKLMKELGLNGLHSRFYKGMGWEIEKKDLPNVQKFVRNCHANGVMALAYVQFSTLYPEIMRKEIPEVDTWAQVNADGRPNPYYASYFRHMPCINCRAWEDYLKKICTIALAEGGFDGIMFDNCFSFACFCERCEKSFNAYLQTLPDKEARFGFADLSDFRIPRVDRKAFDGEVRDPVVQAWIRWRTDTMCGVFRRLRDHIKSVRADAVVSANVQPFRSRLIAPVNGIDMIEMAEMLDLIIGQSMNYPSYRNGILTSRIRDLKLARLLGKPDVCLCDADAMMTPEQEKHYLLPLYEDLVFGGVPTDRTVVSPKAVPGFVDRERLERRRPLLKGFNDFVRANRALFEAPVYTPVRLFYPEKEMQFSQAAHESLCAAEEILSRRQVPWGYVVSRPGRPFDVPAGTEVVVVANQVALSAEQIDALVGWADRGGKLVVTGDSGRYNEFNGQRLANPLLPRLAGKGNVALRKAADVVSPASLGWANKVGASKDNGRALLADLAKTGFRLPFEVENCPETVALDVRRLTDGYVFHFVNYDPAHAAKSVVVKLADGRRIAVPDIVEYAFAK